MKIRVFAQEHLVTEDRNDSISILSHAGLFVRFLETCCTLINSSQELLSVHTASLTAGNLNGMIDWFQSKL